MNTISRGVRNAFRNVIRTGSIVAILGLSIGLVIAMLAARQAVITKIESVKSSVGNTVSIAPAGIRGFEGGGEPLSAEQMMTVESVEHVSSVSGSLSDRLTTDDTTNLTSGIEPGSFGQRQAQVGNSDSTTTQPPAIPEGGESGETGTSGTTRVNPMTSITITGTNNTTAVSTFGGSSLTWVSGQTVDGTADADEAVIGTALAEKNSLSVGSTFTAYGTTLTVVGIYDAGTTFANNGIFTSLATLQRISDQAGSVTSVVATIDSADNLATATTAIQEALGDAADVTNNQETADATIQPLESVKTITTYSLIGAIVAGAVIVLLTMIMVVRERRREIGVMKAIGASNVGIMTQFIVEAITLTGLGLVVGIAGGVLAAAPITDMLVSNSASSSETQQPGSAPGERGNMMGGVGRRSAQTLGTISSSVGVEALLYGLGATVLIAVLGSALPSMMISKIKPAEAMRSE